MSVYIKGMKRKGLCVCCWGGMECNLLFSKKVTDLNGLVSVGDGGIDGKVSVDESHLVTVALGNPSDEVLYMAEGSSDGGTGLARPKPCVDLQLPLPSFPISHEMEV